MLLSTWLTIGLPCALGAAVCVAVLALQPVGQRIAFIAAGLAGSAAGFALWYALIGPRLLP